MEAFVVPFIVVFLIMKLISFYSRQAMEKDDKNGGGTGVGKIQCLRCNHVGLPKVTDKFVVFEGFKASRVCKLCGSDNWKAE